MSFLSNTFRAMLCLVIFLTLSGVCSISLANTVTTSVTVIGGNSVVLPSPGVSFPTGGDDTGTPREEDDQEGEDGESDEGDEKPETPPTDPESTEPEIPTSGTGDQEDKKIVPEEETIVQREVVIGPINIASKVVSISGGSSVQVKTKEEIEQEEPENQLHYLGGQPLAIKLERSNIPRDAKEIVLKVGDNITYKLKEKTDGWQIEFLTPESSSARDVYDLRLEVTKENGEKEIMTLGELLIDPYGFVYQEVIKPRIRFFKGGLFSWDTKVSKRRLKDAKVTLYQFDYGNDSWIEFPAQQYHQVNPQHTDATGEFSFMVPKGLYYLSASHEMFGTVNTKKVEVVDVVISENIKLSRVILPWWKVLENWALITLIVLFISTLVLYIRKLIIRILFNRVSISK